MDSRGNFGPRKRPDARSRSVPKAPSEERLGRFLAFVLRHHPEKLALELDAQGAADIDALVLALQTRSSFKDATRKVIERLATAETSGHRFEILGTRIRARYGHSLPQPVEYGATTPPPVLFYGTTEENARLVLKQGLKQVQQRRGHLSTDAKAARTVGLRRTPSPVILKVDASRAAKAGIRFYAAGPVVWLSDEIPPDYITRAE